MALTEKFKSKDISTLRAAANGEIFLDVKNPKLFKIDDIVIYEREEVIPIFRRPITAAESSSEESSPV